MTGRTRREEYAEQTRLAIVDAARVLFRERGYVATRVEEIAATARVSPATVYGVAGGKQGLLHTLIDDWSTAPLLNDVYAAIGQLDDGAAVLARTAEGTRVMREQWGDVMQVALTTARHDEGAAAAVTVATQRYREGLAVAARRLEQLGVLREGIDVDAAVDVLWFFFGYGSYQALVAENGWTFERAEQWLLEQSVRGLLSG
jgi:AcrR family transcriptional regulator